MKSKVYIAGFVWCFVSFFVLSATPCLASITGTVTDTTGSTVTGALVTFTDESNADNEYSAYTDNEGKYSIALTPVSVKEETPANFQLYQNYPNPFNPSTTIPFSLNEAGFVNLSIYNIAGQKVRTLVNNYHSAGSHTITWNGLDDSGKSVAAGLYIYQIKFGDAVESRKMLLIDGGSSGSFKGAYQIDTRSKVMAKSVSDTANKTFLVTITGDDIVPYEESGVTVVDGGTYDFVVIGKTSEIPDITFVSIPGGTFQMGSNFENDSDNSYMGEGKFDDELPIHDVTLSEFDMSTTEITNAQYAVYLNEALALGNIDIFTGDVYGNTDDWFRELYIEIGYVYNSSNKCWIQHGTNKAFTVTTGKENWPVIAVTWYGAKAFAQYYGFDLPTEAEWEYAARGGKQYKYGTDDGTIIGSKANYNKNIGFPVNVGTYSPNPFGLYDMCGNVWEWCNDKYGDYSSDSAYNPTGPLTGLYSVARGGCWGDHYRYCRTAFRRNFRRSYALSSIGFRVVRRPGGVTY